MSNIELHERYPLSRREDITDAYMRGVEVGRKMGRGTCRNISPKLGNDEFTCEECLARVYGSGGQWFDANWEYHKFNFCPNCGREVVDG